MKRLPKAQAQGATLIVASCQADVNGVLSIADLLLRYRERKKSLPISGCLRQMRQREGIAIFYLNSAKAYDLFKQAAKDPYYVDKSMMLAEIADDSICIGMPRGFGKTTNALMIASYFSSGVDSSEIFSRLKIGKTPHYAKCHGKRSVIFIPLGEKPPKCKTCEAYINFVKNSLASDLREAYPDVACESDDPAKLLAAIHKSTGERFMFVLDDWDFIFRSEAGSKFASTDDKTSFYLFLVKLLSGDHLLMAYLTGVYPLPMTAAFKQYSVDSKEFKKFFGFNATEIKTLVKRYSAQLKEDETPNIDCGSLREWYLHKTLCNPYSTVRALKANKLDFYWVNAAPKNELINIIKINPQFCRHLAYLASNALVQGEEDFYVDLPFDRYDNDCNLNSRKTLPKIRA
jgi:hypothetical protein